ncbi:MAG: hypothetical protein KDB62_03800 [Solirubrobacterales bacterium]|nr:hypothetical protein [Solirubrobacterales bacterium]
MEERTSFYSAGISSFETICLAAGIGISIGMITGTTGLEGSARGRMTLLTAVIALFAGYMAASFSDGIAIVSMIFCALFAGFACAVISGVIAGATRRGGTAALALFTIVGAVAVALVTVLFPPVAMLFVAGLVWLAFARRRRAARKHAGLRVLR